MTHDRHAWPDRHPFEDALLNPEDRHKLYSQDMVPDTVAAWRAAGEAYGALYGRRLAEDAAYREAFQQAVHAQIEANGLCVCPGSDITAKAADLPVHVIGVDGMHEALQRIRNEATAAKLARANQDGSAEPVVAEDADPGRPAVGQARQG